MAGEIFISYRRADEAWARLLHRQLNAEGVEAWYDALIGPGQEWRLATAKALEDSKIFVLLFSENAAQSSDIAKELAAATHEKKLVIPVRLQNIEPKGSFLYELASRNWVNAYEDTETKLAELAKGLAHLVRTGARDENVLPFERTPSGPERSIKSVLNVASTTTRPRGLTRRNLADGAVAATALGGSGLFFLRNQRKAAPPGVEPLLAQAWQAWTQGTKEGSTQAIGLYLRATQLAPDYPDAWGFLGCVYADRAHFAPASEQADLRERAREAGRRAQRLDPQNAYGRMAVAYARPLRGNWLLMEREFRQAMRDQPGKSLVTYSLALSLNRVGRLAEAAALFNQLRGASPTANQYQFHIKSLWGSGQIGEAEQLLQEATSIFALNANIWTIRFDMLMASGHIAAASALAQDTGARPGGVTDQWLSRRMAVAQAAISRLPADIEAVAGGLAQDARQDAGLAKRSIEELSMLGRIDEAFTILAAYFFSRGFVIPDAPASTGLPTTPTLASRETLFLFLPTARALRADPRFDRLVEDIGLTRYWREVGVQPDYRKA